MDLYIAVAKLPKFGYLASGDTVELVERPRGGMTCVMADGQGHGPAAKRLSTLVANKAVNLIADGARDGAAARAVHDYLYALRDGKVSSELTLVSVDMRTKTLVVSRNSRCPVFLRIGESGPVQRLDEMVQPIGVHEAMKPAITEVPLQPGTVLLTFTDGVLGSGARYGQKLSLERVEAMVGELEPQNTQQLADELLDLAYRLDERRPSDDMSVLAVGLAPPCNDERIRRMSMTIPF